MADNCKFQKTQYQVSYDSGTTWENVVPTQFAKGELLEYDSPDCSGIDVTYRWRTLEGQYLCDGNNKYTKQIQEESYNNGITWYASYPTVYRQGEYVGEDTEFCCDKFVGHYYYIPSSSGGGGGGGHISCGVGSYWNGVRCVGKHHSKKVDPLKVVKCDETTILTSADTKYYTNDYYLFSAEIGNSVTSIDDKAFSACTYLTSIDIPSGVTTIGQYAFANCSGMTSVTIPDSVTSIGERAFQDCTSLTSCTIGSGVTSIGYGAFRYCSGLISITVNAITPPTLGTNVFNNTNDCPIYVPCESLFYYRTVSGWSDYADRIQGIPPCSEPSTGGTKFYATYNDNTTYSAECVSVGELTSATTKSNGHDYEGMTSAEIGNCVTSIGNSVFSNCKSLTSVTIGSGVTSIGNEAFYNCSGLTSIDIPNSVTSIGYNAFRNCSSLTSCTIGSGVTSIGNYAFRDCTSLTSIDIPNSVTSIGIDAFYNTPWWNTYSADTSNQFGNIIYINDVAYKAVSTSISSCSFKVDTISIGSGAFRYCSGLTSVIILDSVTSIGEMAFASCTSLTSIDIPNSVTTIGNWAFVSCRSLTSIDIPNSVTTIGDSVFSNCTSLTSVTIPDNITSIGNFAFYTCSSLRSCTIGNGVISIGEWAFNSCTSLTSITIPNSVTTIERYAFEYCSGLTSITVNATTPPTLGTDAFFNTNNCRIYVPSGSVNTYKSTSGWSDYASRIRAIT